MRSLHASIIAFMTDYFKAAILGIIEGVTEYLPVSSTGHLIIAGKWLEFSSANTQTFDIAIQLGAILAVFLLYRPYFMAFFSPKNWFKKDMNILITACLPALILGFLMHSFIKAHLFSEFTVAIALITGAFGMIAVQLGFKDKADTVSLENISYKQAFIIGCFQCLALWPGMSRSASTIAGGLIAKLDYETSAKFSFLVAVPIMLAAVSYDLIKTAPQLSVMDIKLIAIGFLVSFVVAWASIVTFLSLLKRWKLIPFACYRLVLGGFIILF